jgi:outer membrane lipoprotein SlyB
MNMKRRRIVNLACAVLCSMLLGSCTGMSPEGRNQMLGGLGGAALGAGIGALATGGDTTAILAGAAAGAVAGWAAVKLVQYQAEKTSSAKQEAKALGYRPSDGTLVKLRGASVTPKRVRPGDRVTLNMDYAVLAPPGTDRVPVREIWTLEKDGETLASVPPQQEQRVAGGWHARAGIDIPKEAGRGTYVVKNRIEAGESYDERESTFTVR